MKLFGMDVVVSETVPTNEVWFTQAGTPRIELTKTGLRRVEPFKILGKISLVPTE